MGSVDVYNNKVFSHETFSAILKKFLIRRGNYQLFKTQNLIKNDQFEYLGQKSIDSKFRPSLE